MHKKMLQRGIRHIGTILSLVKTKVILEHNAHSSHVGILLMMLEAEVVPIHIKGNSMDFGQQQRGQELLLGIYASMELTSAHIEICRKDVVAMFASSEIIKRVDQGTLFESVALQSLICSHE